MNLFAAIFDNVSRDCTAILFEQRQISYGELRAETLQLARLLGRLGVERDERVALVMHDSPEFISAFIAICSSGAIAVPINTALRLNEQRTILNDCTARALFIEAEFAVQMLSAPERLPHLRDVVIVDREEAGSSKRQSDTIAFAGTRGEA